MAQYQLIDSRDPFESNDVGYYYDLAKGLVEGGDQVKGLGRVACPRLYLTPRAARSNRSTEGAQ